MPCFEIPTVLVTRPRASSDVFVKELRACAGAFRPLISPAFEVEGTGDQIPSFDVAVFSSRAAVRFAPKGRGRLAFCVGDATARDATRAGYDSQSAQGAFDDLIALILKRRPQGRLLHLRGETTVGDLRGALRDAGLSCAEIVTYRKVNAAPVGDVKAVIASDATVLLPVFSAETVSILAGWGLDFTHTHVVAISEAVAKAAQVLHPATTIIADRPDQAAMTVAVASMIA